MRIMNFIIRRTSSEILRDYIDQFVSNCSGEERDYVIRVIRPFVRKGWTFVDTAGGAFARAILVSPDNKRVIKVSGDWHDYNRFGIRFSFPDSFKRFAIWAARQSSPNLPKFYRVASLRKHGLFFCEMEKLEKVDGAKIYDVMDGYIPESWLSDTEWEIFQIVDASMHYKNDVSMKDETVTYRLSNQLGKTLRRLIDALGYPNDLHANNIMLRGQTPVILDPYANFPGREWYEGLH